MRKIWVSNRLTYLMDASKAFDEVLLEQVSFSIVKGEKTDSVSVGSLNQHENLINIFGTFPLNEVFSDDLKNAQIYKRHLPEVSIK